MAAALGKYFCLERKYHIKQVRRPLTVNKQSAEQPDIFVVRAMSCSIECLLVAFSLEKVEKSTSPH